MDNKGDKKIVFFDGNLKQGGAERVISLLANKLAQDGKRVCVLLYQDEELFYELDSRIEVVSVQKETKTRNLIRNIKWIHQFFSEHAEVAISFLATINIVALFAHFGLKCPIIVADRNDPRFVPSNYLIRKTRDFLYTFADGVVLQTTQNKAYFSKKVQSKSIVIPNPVDLGEKKGLGLRVEKKNEIVSVGRLMPQKNQIMLIEAFSIIANEYPDYELIIYGEGPEREKLEKRTMQLGISSRVFLPGSVKNIYDLIARSQLFVLSSNYEGMPNALIEALCIGVPCLATNVSGVSDLIKNGKNGEIIPVGDTCALAERLRVVLDDETKRDRYGRNATALNDLLSLQRILGVWLSFIESIKKC